MTRLSNNEYRGITLYNGYDYEKQVWVLNGTYQRCGHMDEMNCGCYGKVHAGERVERKHCTACGEGFEDYENLATHRPVCDKLSLV